MNNSRFPPVVRGLIITNVLVFIAQITFGTSFNLTEKLLLYPAMPQRLHDLLVSQNGLEASDKFQVYQIITHMFAHSPTMFAHILFNMFTLWMFGSMLENVWGSKRFLNFYLICGIGAAIFHLAIQYYRCELLLQAIDANDQLKVTKYLGALSPALGASGAIMGVMVAFAYLFPNTPLYIMFIPIPIKAKWAIIGFAAYDLFGGTVGVGDNVAHFAHLGGAITGIIIVMIWNKNNRSNFY
jgi:rhomboid-like protein